MVIELILFIFSTHGALTWNPTLESVAEVRQTPNQTELKIDPNIATEKYLCRVAVTYPYKNLVGQEVWFIEDGNKSPIGPFIVVDFQATRHHNDKELNMQNNGLLGDIDCLNLVHAKGRFAVRKKVRVNWGLFDPQ